jgi:Domain of unknown function (DUF4232)
MRNQRSTILGLIGAIAALALSACGSAGSTSSSQSNSSTGSSTSSGQSASQTSSLSTSSETTSAGPPPCKAATLSLSFLGGLGATGHGELGFALKNTGSSSCNTIGYPGIQFLSASGGALPTTPSHTTDDFFGHLPLKELIVAPGDTVSFRLGVTHGAASGGAGCTTAHGLQVIAPNDTATLRVTLPNGAYECAAATVSPMQPGTSAFR